MDSVIQEITRRIEAVIVLTHSRARSEESDFQRSQYEAIASNLESYRISLISGRLPAAGMGIGLGAARAVSEWNLQDEDIETAIHEIERLYRTGS